MPINKKIPKLTDSQNKILKAFILKFLPKRGNKRKNSGNEVNYVHKTLDLIVNKRFGFHLTKDDIVSTFQELEYDIFLKSGELASQSISHYPVKYLNTNAVKSDFDYQYAHIDISPITVRLLKGTTYSQSRTLDKDQVAKIETLNIEMELFEKQFK